MSPEYSVYIPQESSSEFIVQLKKIRGAAIRDVVLDNDMDRFVESTREVVSLLPSETRIADLHRNRHNADTPAPWVAYYNSLPTPRKRLMSRALYFIQGDERTANITIEEGHKVRLAIASDAPTYIGPVVLDYLYRVFPNEDK